MNKTFKTIWNEARRSYIVTNEAQKTHGKPSKCAVALAVAATALFAGVASAAYVDPGQVATSSSDVEHAKTTWVTDEYNGDWGLEAINASTAYALGYHGQGVKVGVVDSGIAIDHPEFQGDRWHTVTAKGEYSTTDTRYPNGNGPKNDVNDNFEEGQEFEISGEYIQDVNDSHGTHVSGTIGANRDGVGMHGVAWGADMYVGNTGGTDSMTYGPNQDYGYFKAVYQALADEGVRIVNQSWGSNRNNSRPGGIDWSTTMPTLNDVEQAWYDFDQYKNGTKTFVDAALEVAKANDIIFTWTNGNGSNSTPYTRAALPYFRPDAESHWMAVAASTSSDSLAGYSGKAGYAKWWTITAPGNSINSANSEYVVGNTDDPYTKKSGTSMAAPYASGALAVVMSRYSYMTSTQARDTMFTTATTEQGGTVMTDTPNENTGWGYVNLDTAMYGPGQFLGVFDVSVNTDLDVWSNNITNTALDARKLEDEQEAEAWSTRKAELDAKETLTADEQSEYKYKEARAQARADRVYEGSLVKRGQGTLVMTGNNTYRGGTTVEEGMLLGFNDSFGVTGDDATATANGQVAVKGGTFGVINSYDDQFTMKGEINDEAADHSVDVTVEANGRYAFVAGQDVEVGNLTFEEGAGYTVVSLDSDVLVDAYNGITAKGSVTADNVEGIENAVARPDYAFFDTTLEVDGNTLTAYLSRNEEAPMSYASSDSERAVAAAMMAGTDSAFFATMVDSTKDQMKSTLASLGNDLHLAAQNATVVNSVTLARTIKDQASAFGQARTATLDNGAQIWVTGIGQWGNVDAGGASVDMDVDFYAGFIGGEMSYGDRNKVGVFFGYGSTDFDANADGKIESDDIHLGIYGENEWDAVGVTYGLAYTMQDRDSNRSLSVKDQVAHNAISYDADVFQVFGEASYKGFNTDSFQVEPYVGLAYMMVSSDDFTETAAGYSFRTEMEDQNLGVGTVGVRGAIPFTAGSVEMAVKGDVSYMQFFGDTEATAKMSIGDAGVAQLKGDELKGMGAVGLGVEAALGKNTKLGVSYTGAFGSDITSHGVGATLRVNF